MELTQRASPVTKRTLRCIDESASAEPSIDVVLRPSTGWNALDLGDLWNYRELLYFMAIRDVAVRYKQTLLGAAWAILQPVLTMVVFSVFFGHLGKIPSDGIPYPIFAFCALLPWQLFASSVTQSGNSLISSQNLITKVYFPRLVIPIAPVLSALVDFAIAFGVLIVMMIYYGVYPQWTVVTLPLFIALDVLACLSVGIWLSAMNAMYRDIRYTIPFLVQFWMFITPVAYPASMVPEKWRWAYGLNPMTGVVEGFRWAMIGKTDFPLVYMCVSVPIAVVLLISGMYYFKRVERSFADRI